MIIHEYEDKDRYLPFVTAEDFTTAWSMWVTSRSDTPPSKEALYWWLEGHCCAVLQQEEYEACIKNTQHTEGE